MDFFTRSQSRLSAWKDNGVCGSSKEGRTYVDIFHRREVFPTARGLQCFIVYACEMSMGSERMPEAVRRLAVDIDGVFHALS